MKSTLLTYIDRFRQNRRERLVLGSVLLFLAVIVSLIVYWQLRYTGITMSNETFCGYEEHVHTEECYDEEGNLICELEEHSHTVDCLINLNADVEDATVWKATLPELTGDLRTDVVNIAYSQLGYTESTANFSPGEDGVTRYGYTRYGAWYGNEYGTWDAMFVSFCLNYAGVDRTAFPLNSGAYSWAVELSEIGSYAEASAYTPLAGDIVFFDTDLDGRIDRVGIVASTDISGGVVTIIEGDYTVSEVDTVCEHIYALNDPTISGYGIIATSEEVEEETEEAEAEETDDETEDTEESEEIEIEEIEEIEETEETEIEETEESPTLFYTASDSGVNVTVIAPEGALPDGAILAVTLLDEESDEYAEAAEAVGYESADTDENAINAISEDDTEESEEVATALAVLDISFTVDGETVEPTEAVTVIIDASSLMSEDADTSTLEVQHLEETPEGITPVLVADATEDTEGTVDTETAVAEFTVESFSTFTLRWTYNEMGGTGYTSATVNVLDTSGADIDYTSTSYAFSQTISGTTITLSSGTTVNLTTLLTMDGYEFSYATVSATYQAEGGGGGGGGGTATVTDNNATYIIYTKNDNRQGGTLNIDGTTYSVQSVNSLTINLYFVASSTATLTVNKVYTDSSGNALDSSAVSSLEAVFTATPTSGTAKAVTITGASSDTLSLSAGTYTISESTVPEGYTASSDVTVTVDSNGKITDSGGNEITSVTMTNTAEKTVTLYINKVYETSDGTTTTDGISTLKATFTATPTVTTTSTKTVDITGANIGELALVEGVTYTLSETAAGGYTAASDMTVEVSGGVIYVDGTAITDNDNTITVTNSPDDNHKYAGMTYAIVNVKRGYALTSDKNGDSYLNGLAVTTEVDGDDTYATAADGTSEVTVWTFVATSTPNVYYITDGNGNYLNISSSAVTVSSTTPQEILVTEGSGSYEGMVRLTAADSTTYGVNLYGGQTYFGAWYTSDENEWQTLCLVTKKDGVYITDDIAASGNLVASLVINGEEVDITDSSKYTIVWEKDSPEIDSEACTWTYSGSYEEVTNEEALSDLNHYAVNVALDGGALAIYKVTIYDATTNEEIGYATYEVPYADELMNCSFEVPSGVSSHAQLDENSVPFWLTTESYNTIEIGAYSGTSHGTQYIYAGGSQAAAGDQYAELNSNAAGSLYQDVLTIGGEALNWSLYHRARTSDMNGQETITDTMYVVIMSAEDAETVLAYADSVSDSQQDVLTAMIESVLADYDEVDGKTNAADSASGEYTLGNGETVTVTVWQLTTTTTKDGEWVYYYGEYEVPDDQYLTRFFFVAGETGYNKDNPTIGNLIDYATFSQDITYVIEYWTKDSGATEYTLQSTYTEKDTVDPYTNVYASYLSVFSDYGLVGSVTGTTSGGSNPSTFDEITTTGMRVQSGTVYLSLYLSKPVVTIIKVVEGLSEEEIDAYLDAGNTYTVGFTITPSANALPNSSLSITVGETGSGSTYTAESEYTAAGNYSITESGYPTSITIDGVDYEWKGATVTVDGTEVPVNTDGSYTYYIDGQNSVTITFTNTYAEVVTGGPEMPQTGGRGTKLYTMVGLLLMCSGGYLLYRKQRRKCKWRWNI